MTIDPESVGLFIGAVLSSAGVTWGGKAALDRRAKAKESEASREASPLFCAEHHQCFQEIKDELRSQGKDIGDMKENVAYIRGAIDKR